MIGQTCHENLLEQEGVNELVPKTDNLSVPEMAPWSFPRDWTDETQWVHWNLCHEQHEVPLFASWMHTRMTSY